jgi:peptidoglycan/xylan/chitin deacetylase (PgdA/CDA1 family)
MLNKLSGEKIISFKFLRTPISLLARKKLKLIVPYFHMVSDNEVLHIKHLYPHKTVKQFKDDLDFLAGHFNPISLFDLIDFLKKGRPLPRSAFLITFDDGFRENHDIIAPILLEKGIPGTFFICSRFTDNKHMCYEHKASILATSLNKETSRSVRKGIKAVLFKYGLNTIDIKYDILSISYPQEEIIDEVAGLMGIDFKDYLKKNVPYMTTGQIKKLINKGFAIGAHSIDHPLYAFLSLEDQLSQTMESVEFVRKRFDLNYGAFAFPYNDNLVPKKFFNKIFRSGLIDISFSTAGLGTGSVPNHINRFCLDNPSMPAEESIALLYARRLKGVVSGNNVPMML